MSFEIPVYQPDLSGREKAYVNECLDSSWISSKGSFIQRFEQAFSEFTGLPWVTSVNNGTTAIQAAVAALGLQPGDEVIVPAFTYIASVNPLHQVGAVPVFVDSDAATWQIDVGAVERAITPRTKAIMAVHLYGGACDIEALARLASVRGVALIEDCAEAFGTRVAAGKHVGMFGDIATFSFFGNKTITTGEGGMVVAKTKALLEKVYAHKNQGLASYREYWHDQVGFNYRMTNICAAIGLAQLERAEQTLQKKRALADWYHKKLAALPVTFQAAGSAATHSHWMVSFLCESAQQRDLVRRRLNEARVETRPLFPPVVDMPMYSARYVDVPVARDLSGRGLNVPSWPGLSEAQVDKICSVVRAAVNETGTRGRN